MKAKMRNATLCAVLLLISLLHSFSSKAINYTNLGTNTIYNLYAGDTLHIKSGIYSGVIATFNTSAVIVVDPNATFKPNNLANPKGTIINNGTILINYYIAPNAGFSVQNFNAIKVTGSVQMNGFQTWNNRFGATMEIGQSLTMNAFSSLTNEGTLTVGDDVTLNMFSSFTNKNTVNIGGDMEVNIGEYVNEGETNTAGMLTFNWGSTFTNTCRMITEGGFTNNCYSFENLGLLWVGTTGTNADHFINNGTFINGPNGVVRSVRLTNNQTITGSGKMYFTGQTINYGTFGTSGTTADTIRVYDVSRTSPSRIFDVQYGTVRPNVVYNVFAEPDTNVVLGSCSNIYRSNIALPVKWSSFFVNLSNNTPNLNWASQQTEGTRFEIQRSYDGSNFSTIADMPSDINKESYNFADLTVNTQSPVVYYRIKGIEISGAISYTETRLVKFSNKQGVSIQVAPNPFTSQFSINYQSDTRETISIRVFNMNGQLHMTKNASVAKGYNSISVPVLSNLSKGMYVVQVSGENGVIATQRVVKN